MTVDERKDIIASLYFFGMCIGESTKLGYYLIHFEKEFNGIHLSLIGKEIPSRILKGLKRKLSETEAEVFNVHFVYEEARRILIGYSAEVHSVTYTYPEFVRVDIYDDVLIALFKKYLPIAKKFAMANLTKLRQIEKTVKEKDSCLHKLLGKN